ncbi:MAG: tetratricopeptide repeat protein, partial [Planctomycetota bacterium]|nr:tetratricopeptide repeat protein [Planctomycetota bacterium]
MRWVLATGLVAAALAAGCREAEAPVTWAGGPGREGVAALIHEHCSTCHRPGQPGPFALLEYEDVHRKRRQIARVTASGYMPPWLPSHGEFVGERGLSAAEVALLGAWVAAGAPRGDQREEPAPPEFNPGWQLGPPDLVLTAQEWVEVSAEGPDVFRNLVLPVEAGSLRFVEAVEVRPGSPSVHHGVLQVDVTRDARARDAADPGPGFGGMEMGLSTPPDGHFLGWTPGKGSRRSAPGRAWRLWPGSDLVLQLHLTPTGKPERVRPQVGLYFTDVAPREKPFPLVLRSELLDIAAGVTDFMATDALVLPVAVELRAVYPHAHYLCTDMVAWATLPSGSRLTLFEIHGWDFDWQDDYHYRRPLRLPAGTRVEFEYTYDNSAGNPHNPAVPPRRVRYGLESTDEMATLSLTLVPDDPADRGMLPWAMARRAVERTPEEAPAWVNLCVATREAPRTRGAEGEGDRLVEAAAHARRALELDPGHPAALRELGICRLQQGDAERAERLLRR